MPSSQVPIGQRQAQQAIEQATLQQQLLQQQAMQQQLVQQRMLQQQAGGATARAEHVDRDGQLPGGGTISPLGRAGNRHLVADRSHACL